jgi:hypothetical protein
VNENADALDLVPPQVSNYEHLCEIALNQNGMMLSMINKTHKNCLLAVKQNGYALQFVPPEMRDEEICLAAVKKDRRTMQYVPMNLRDKIKHSIHGEKKLRLLSRTPRQFSLSTSMKSRLTPLSNAYTLTRRSGPRRPSSPPCLPPEIYGPLPPNAISHIAPFLKLGGTKRKKDYFMSEKSESLKSSQLHFLKQ